MKKVTLGLIALFFLAGILPAQASIVLKMSDQYLTQRATSIVHGKVVNKTSRWGKNRRRIYTFVTLSVLKMVKGKATKQEVTIRQLGGESGKYGMRVPGTARFSLGEEVLVFLQKKATVAEPMIMGMAWGKFKVYVDPRTKERLIERNLNGLTLAVKNKAGRVVIQHKHKHKTDAHNLKHVLNKTHQHKQKLVTLKNYLNKIQVWLKPASLQTPTPVRPAPRLQK